MVDLPPKMLKDGRGKDQAFLPDEQLYRRVPISIWEDKSETIETDAIELPDMSVIRSKYGHPEWARFDEEGNYHFEEWGVIGFNIRDIPTDLLHLGSFLWTFRPRHVPLDSVYPHSEVWAFENGEHVNAKAKLDPQLHLRWRELLLRCIKKLLGPYETVDVRQEPPNS